MKDFSANIGDIIDRSAIHAVYGGRTQSRISPAGDARYLFLFIDPIGEEAAGCPSGMAADGCLHVAGEGLSRDQVMKSGNLSLLRHAEEGKALHVLTKVEKGRFRYVGRFRIAPGTPFYRVDMPSETSPDVIRDGIVFRLQPEGPVGAIPKSVLVSLPGSDPVQKTAAETLTLPDGKASRLDVALAASYALWMARLGFDLRAMSVTPDDEYQAIKVPVYDEGSGHVYCPCASSSRAAVRNAVGEAMDLKRVTGAGEATLLLPSEPREDVMRLVEYAGLGVDWPRDNGWHMSSRISGEPSTVGARDIRGSHR